MITRKQFIAGFSMVSLGLLASPLLAVGPSDQLNEKEKAQLDLAFDQLFQGHSTDQFKPWLTLLPVKILKRTETKKGYKTTYRARNGSVVVLENFGKPLTRFY